jgi:hypothetical protein
LLLISRNKSILYLVAVPLINWLVLCSLAACQKSCHIAAPEKTKLVLAVSQNILQEHEKKFSIIVKNTSTLAAKEVDVTNIRLVATISQEEGGSGSQLEYMPAQGDKVQTASMSESLAQLTGNNELEGQDKEIIELSLIPGQDVSSLTITIKLYDGDTSIDTKKVNWYTITPQLELDQVHPSLSNQAGSLTIKVTQKDLNPSKITVRVASSNKATFLWNGKASDNIKTLADLLENHDLIKAGTTIGPIFFEIAAENGTDSAEISLQLRQGNKNLLVGNNQVSWTRKDINLQWTAATYVSSPKKQLTYTITNTGKNRIDTTDQIRLQFSNVSKNAAVLRLQGQALASGEILLQETDFQNGIASASLEIDLQGAEQAEFKLILWYGDKPIGEEKIIQCTKDIQLVIAQIGSDKNEPSKIVYSLQNAGTDVANQVTLNYESKNPHTMSTIDGKKAGHTALLTIPAKIANNPGEITGELGILDLQTAGSASFDFVLEHNGIKIPETLQTVTFVAKDLQLELKNLDFTPIKQEVTYEITKLGKSLIEPSDNITLSYRTSNQATLDKVTRQEIKLDAAALEQINQGEYKGKLDLDFLDTTTTQVTLVLRLDSKQLGDQQTIDCTKDIKLTFTRWKFDGSTKKVMYQLQNTGKTPADRDKVGILVTNRSRFSAKFGNKEFMAGEEKIVNDATFIGSSSRPIAGVTGGMLVVDIDPLSNAEVIFTLQLTYQGQPMGTIEKLIWKKAPTLAIKQEPAEAVLQGSKQKQVTLLLENTTGRKLEASDLKTITFNYKHLPGGYGFLKTIGDKKDLREKALTELGITELGIDKVAQLVLNIDSTITTTFEISLEGTEQLVVHLVTWKALPTINLAIDQQNNQFIKVQSRKLKLTLTSNKNLSQADLQAIQINYTKDQPAGSLKLGQEDIQGKDLYTLLSNYDLDANSPIELSLELEGFNPDNKRAITTVIISLQGAVEPNSVEVQKLGQ